MNFLPTALKDVKKILALPHEDERGFFMESWNHQKFFDAGIVKPFVQENHSRSKYGVLRGLHYQYPYAQGKLVRCVKGEILDVVVDLRQSSPTFGDWQSFYLHEALPELLWIPRGFAHGFVVLSNEADFIYKVDNYWHPECEQVLKWDDPTLEIEWMLPRSKIRVSSKDLAGVSFKECLKFP